MYSRHCDDVVVHGARVFSLLPFFFFFKQKTAYEMRISDWSSDVCSSDLDGDRGDGGNTGECGGDLPHIAAARASKAPPMVGPAIAPIRPTPRAEDEEATRPGTHHAAVVDLARGKRVRIFAPAPPAMHRRWFNALRSSCGPIVEAQFFTTRSPPQSQES